MADEIAKTVLGIARSKNASRILEIELEIGQLTFLNEEQLKFCLNVLFQNTIAEGVEIKCGTIATEIECERCSYRGASKRTEKEDYPMMPIYATICGRCGSSDTRIISGNQCIVKSIRIKTH